jgi:hypothetical protein
MSFKDKPTSVLFAALSFLCGSARKEDIEKVGESHPETAFRNSSPFRK